MPNHREMIENRATFIRTEIGKFAARFPLVYRWIMTPDRALPCMLTFKSGDFASLETSREFLGFYEYTYTYSRYLRAALQDASPEATPTEWIIEQAFVDMAENQDLEEGPKKPVMERSIWNGDACLDLTMHQCVSDMGFAFILLDGEIKVEEGRRFWVICSSIEEGIQRLKRVFCLEWVIDERKDGGGGELQWGR